ncbi:MAG: Rid family hydrolase [Chloroflexota bacterium]
MKKAIFTEKGAKPRGPYSQAIIAQGPQVFISAQGPNDPETGEQRLGPFAEQAELVFQNISTLLEAAGTSWEHVVKMTIYLADDGNFATMNEIYQRYCIEPYPARTTIRATVGQSAIVADCIALIPLDG